MDSRIRHRPTFFVLALAICALASAGFAQQPGGEPASINRLANTTGQLSAEQRRQIADYARYWSAALMSDDFETARRARRRLVEPFSGIGVGRIFRDEYARAAMPELDKVLDSDNTFAAVNAIQVAADFRNDQALSVMRERCGTREQRWQVRLWAARGLGRIAREAEDIPPRTIVSAVRDLTRAGENERHWLVLQRQFEALAAIGTDEAREAQVSVLRATLARISDDAEGPSDQMQAVHRALLLLRNQLLDPGLSSAQLRSLGTATGPLLGEILEIGVMHWDSANADDDIRAAYNGAMAMTKNLLELIDSQVRGEGVQRPRFASAWGNGSKANYEADVNQWRQVLGAPPYVRR